MYMRTSPPPSEHIPTPATSSMSGAASNASSTPTARTCRSRTSRSRPQTAAGNPLRTTAWQQTPPSRSRGRSKMREDRAAVHTTADHDTIVVNYDARTLWTMSDETRMFLDGRIMASDKELGDAVIVAMAAYDHGYDPGLFGQTRTASGDELTEDDRVRFAPRGEDRWGHPLTREDGEG